MPTVTGESTTPAKVHTMLAATGSKACLHRDLMMDRRQKSGISTAYVLRAIMRPATGACARDIYAAETKSDAAWFPEGFSNVDSET